MKEFFKASLRTATAISLVLLGLAIAIGIYSLAKDFYEKQQAKPFEEIRVWKFDLKNPIGVEVQARTKLVAGNLLGFIEVIGYPKYFSDLRNVNASLIFEFLDKDGFRIISTPVKISDFTIVVGKDGKNTGLGYQIEKRTSLEQYKRFSRMQVGWNLITEAAVQPPPQKPVLDHCAPNISKNERLQRLAQHGTVREIGKGAYRAAEHSVFFFYDGTLLNCR
ncbi:hypothetical protein RI537_13355 [Aeromonas salmonicida]|uniref:hypothetical protein n=1 Tax=Aeromonas salmonicida TaxID=645 RepID=UPI003430B886